MTRTHPDTPRELLALEKRLHRTLLYIGLFCMADGLTSIPSNPAAAFALGLGLAIPGMIDTTRCAYRAMTARNPAVGE